MRLTNYPKATLYVTDGDQVMACFDITNITVEEEYVKAKTDGRDELGVSMTGHTTTNILPPILKMRRPDRVRLRNRIADLPRIQRVLFNYPATIVFWEDGTKTVAKVQDDDLYDEKRGIVVCMLKKMMGNDNSYNKLMNAVEKEAAKWVGETNV